MKSIAPLLSIAGLFLLTLIISCKKSTTTTNPANNTPAYTSSFSYKKNGASQTANSVTTSIINLGGFSYIAIAGNSASPAQVLNLWIDPSSVPGNYTFGFVGDSYVMQYSNPALPAAYTTSDGGNLNITKHDKSAKIIEGTFYGTVYDDIFSPTDSIVISSGSFKAKY